MKLVLSRKGFDSRNGAVPSPILPDGRMVSLPIPDRDSPVTYADITYDGESLGPLVESLTQGRIPPHYRAHLDPDLVPASLSRPPGWGPLLGQKGSPQGHLRNQDVGPGDLFLFYGLYQRVKASNVRSQWVFQGRKRHVIWGWLQVDEIIPLADPHVIRDHWAAYHPHAYGSRGANNTLYISRRNLDYRRV